MPDSKRPSSTPAVQEHKELASMVFESLEEHRQVKTLLRELGRVRPGSDKFKAKLKVLKDDVEHHAEEEEEGKMFPKVRKAINSKELEELGQEMEAAKQKRLRRASSRPHAKQKTKSSVSV